MMNTDEVLKEIENELKELEEMPEIEEEEEELPKVEEIKPKKKGASKERMQELHQIKKTKKQERDELKTKAEEVDRIKREKIEFEYEQALKLKNAIDKKKKDAKTNTSVEQTPIQKAREINKGLIKNASRDILKEKWLQEAKKRVMADLFNY